MWQDVSLLFFGPPGYVGPPDAVRAQIWLNKPNQTKMIAGPLGGIPEIQLSGRDKGFHHATIDNLFRWYYLAYERYLALGTDIDHLSLSLSRLEEEKRRLLVKGIEDIANHQTLVVDEVTQTGQLESRMWVDTLTGVILRKRLYAQSDPDVVILDAITNQIDYDKDFPANTFEPETGTESRLFARDHISAPITGKPNQSNDRKTFPVTIWAPQVDREPYQSFHGPPADFDPAKSRITFQVTPTFTSREHQFNLPDPYAEIFADGYYLNSLNIGDLFSVICDRSPNGKLLALAQGRTSQRREESHLTWISLSEPRKTNGIDLQVDLSHFAFAPDNRRLTIFGFGDPLGSLFILDTVSGKLTKLLNLEYVRSMMWSPDGKYLAIIGNWESPEYNEEVIVINSETGEVIYYSPYNFGDELTALDIPAWIQEITFPEYMGGLDACAAPPEERIVQ